MNKERETHETRLLKYLREHPEGITQLEGTKYLHNTRLGATVFNLRNKNFNIKTVNESGLNCYGEKTTYGRYILVE